MGNSFVLFDVSMEISRRQFHFGFTAFGGPSFRGVLKTKTSKTVKEKFLSGKNVFN